MLQPISKLFRDRSGAGLDEVDVRHFVERYLRGRIGVSALFCDRAHQGHVVVRALAAPVRQETYLLEYDLAQALSREADFQLKKLTVNQL
jgi:hypothetical protein